MNDLIILLNAIFSTMTNIVVLYNTYFILGLFFSLFMFRKIIEQFQKIKHK